MRSHNCPLAPPAAPELPRWTNRDESLPLPATAAPIIVGWVVYGHWRGDASDIILIQDACLSALRVPHSEEALVPGKPAKLGTPCP